MRSCVMWYFLSAMTQVGYIHPELGVRFKVADIKMTNPASQSQAPIMPDHLTCAPLTLHLRLMQMRHYEPTIGRPGEGATVCVCVCVPNDNASRRKWEENEQRKRVEAEEENVCGG